MKIETGETRPIKRDAKGKLNGDEHKKKQDEKNENGTLKTRRDGETMTVKTRRESGMPKMGQDGKNETIEKRLEIWDGTGIRDEKNWTGPDGENVTIDTKRQKRDRKTRR